MLIIRKCSTQLCRNIININTIIKKGDLVELKMRYVKIKTGRYDGDELLLQALGVGI